MIDEINMNITMPMLHKPALQTKLCHDDANQGDLSDEHT